MNAVSDQTPDLRDYLRPIWRRRWLILVVVVLATAATYVLAERHGAGTLKQYSASTQVYIEVSNPAELVGSSGVSSAQSASPPDGEQMSDLATLFTDQAVTQAAYRRLHLPVGSAGTVTVGLLDTQAAATYGTSILDVQATSSTPDAAARLANAYAAAFLAIQAHAEAKAATAQAAATQAQLRSLPNISSNDSERRSLELEIAQLRAAARNPSPGAYQISPAVAPTVALSTGSHGPILDAAIAAVVALLLAAGLALAVGIFDRRVTDVSAVESSYGRSVLAVLPHVSRRGQLGHTGAAVPAEFIESLRSLRVNLRLLRDGTPPRTLVVASALAGEGKSTLAAHLALVYAESGERVLLVDADLRQPSIARWFGLGARPGLTHVLRSQASLADVVAPVRWAGDISTNGNGNGSHRQPAVDMAQRGGLDVLTHGDLVDNPVPLLATRAMVAMLDAASKSYDTVIVDTAPVLVVADTVPMLGVADAVLFVARLGIATRDAAKRLSEVVARVPNINVAGVVANDVHDTFADRGYGGYYGVRAGYGYVNGNRVRGRSLSRARR